MQPDAPAGADPPAVGFPLVGAMAAAPPICLFFFVSNLFQLRPVLRCPELVEGAAAAVKCEGVYSRLAATPGAIEEEQDCSERRRMSLYRSVVQRSCYE